MNLALRKPRPPEEESTEFEKNMVSLLKSQNRMLSLVSFVFQVLEISETDADAFYINSPLFLQE